MVAPIVVIDSPERKMSIRLALEHLVLSEWHFGAGEQGPPPHVHRLHADCFYVINGAITLSLSDGDRVLGSGAIALIPPNVVHTFRNDGPGEAHFLNIHTPGMSFDRYLIEGQTVSPEDRLALAARHDQHPAPEDGGPDPAAVILRAAGADSVHLAGVEVGFLVHADEALGAIGLVEYTAPPSFPGPPAHVHAETWDAYYVLEGRLAVRIGDERHELGAGDVAAVPPGTVHGFSNAIDAPTRFLDVHAPGGFERYFREMAAAAGGGPPDPETMAEIASRYDVKVV